LNINNTEAQYRFKVVEKKRSYIPGMEALPLMDSIKYYRVILANDSINRSYTFPLLDSSIHIDTIKAIGELLALEGDTRMCALRIKCYNPVKSQIYMGDSKNYSIQVEALFIINQLILDHPFFYASHPILISRGSNAEATMSGRLIQEAYKAYRNWYKVVKKKGIKEVRETKIMPLDGTGISWY
jgi:hypothetical protein